MNLKTLYILSFLCACCTAASGQVINPNIDYEMGNTSYWHFFTGTCCPIVTPVSTPAIPNRHVLTSGSGVDPYGLFPIVSPDGGSYSLKLGNDSIGAQAEKARYFIHIPSSISDFSLLFRYAVVFQDPGHPRDAQPRFVVNAFDSVTNDTIPCAQFTYVADSTLPGFFKSTSDPTVFYKTWTTGNINLSGRAGSTIIIDFATGDCSYGGHFGYGYLDMSAGLFTVTTTQCNTDSVTLNAPAGFDFYSWYNSATGALLGSSKQITIASPLMPTVYTVILRPYNGYGCPDTLTTKVVPSNLVVHPIGDKIICPGSSIGLTAHATDIVPVSYSWTPVYGLGCNTCQVTTAAPAATTRYIVTVTNAYGCQVTDTVNVLVDSLSLSVSQNMQLCAKAPVNIAATAATNAMPVTYAWSPAATLSCTGCAAATAAPDSTTTYLVVVTDSNKCSKQDSIKIFLDTLSIGSGYDTVSCHGYPVVLIPLPGGNALPLSYVWTPATGLSCANCANPSATPDSTTTYMVTVTDAAQCIISDTIKLRIEQCDIYFPSAFTPNNDGLNDIIRPIGHLGYYRDYSLGIFNRWGERVFYSQDISAGWDGVYNNQKQDVGTYFYLMLFTLYGKKHIMKGDFQLIK